MDESVRSLINAFIVFFGIVYTVWSFWMVTCSPLAYAGRKSTLKQIVLYSTILLPGTAIHFGILALDKISDLLKNTMEEGIE